MNQEILADIYESLQKSQKWLYVYEALLRVCKTKEDAKDALLYLINIEKQVESKKPTQKVS